ncbi:MAG TPA: hypothetical protein PLD96_02380, partial [Methanothrix sp.]|nr:hypothetical protein [Methanothrix sp.]
LTLAKVMFLSLKNIKLESALYPADREKINHYAGQVKMAIKQRPRLQSLLILEVARIYLQKALAVFPGGVDR